MCLFPHPQAKGLSGLGGRNLQPHNKPVHPDLVPTETRPYHHPKNSIYFSHNTVHSVEWWLGVGHVGPLERGRPGLPRITLSGSSAPGSICSRPSKALHFFFFLRPQRCWLELLLPPSSLRLFQVGMGASSSLGRPPRSGTSPIST